MLSFLSKIQAGTATLVAGAICLLIGLGAGYWLCWRSMSQERAEPGQVVIAPPTKRFEKVKYVEVPVPIEVPVLTEPDLKALERDYDVELQEPPTTADEIVEKPFPIEEVALRRLPYGGTALLTRELSGRVAVRTVENPRPRFEWDPEWEVGGGMMRDFVSGSTWKPAGWVRWSPGRAWRFRPIVESGFKPDSYVFAGAVAKF